MLKAFEQESCPDQEHNRQSYFRRQEKTTQQGARPAAAVRARAFLQSGEYIAAPRALSGDEPGKEGAEEDNGQSKCRGHSIEMNSLNSIHVMAGMNQPRERGPGQQKTERAP